MVSIEYYSRAREALFSGVISLNPTPGYEVLLPSYVCSVVVDVFEAAKLTPIYYDLTKNLSPEWDLLSQKLTNKTWALVLIHYFGIKQDFQKAKEFCKKYNIKLIEDSAHGFSSEIFKRKLDDMPDLGIAAPRKFLDFRNGGILFRSSNLGLSLSKGPEPGRLSWLLKRSFKKIISENIPITYLLKRKPDYLSKDEGREIFDSNHIWSADSEFIDSIDTINWNKIRLQRQECWRVWQQWGAIHKLTPIFVECKEEDSPLCYAVRINDPIVRSNWFEWGWKNFINVYSWPALPHAVIHENLSGFNDWNEIVCFPITFSDTPNSLRSKLGI